MSSSQYNIQQFAPTLEDGQPTFVIDPLNYPTINVDVRAMVDNDGAYIFTLSYDSSIATTYPGLEFTVMLDKYDKVIDVSGDTGNFLYITLVSPDFSVTQTFPDGIWPNATPIMSFSLKSNGRIFSVVSCEPGHLF